MANLAGIDDALGHFGTYDFQRADFSSLGLGQEFYPAYTDASNYAVGVFMNGAGYTLDQMNAVGSTYAYLFSSNAGASSQSIWWANGWNAAKNGNVNGYGPSGKKCNSCPCQ